METNPPTAIGDPQSEKLRQQLADMLGIPRPRCELAPEFRGQAKRDGIVVERWIWTSELGSRVTSLLYRPEPNDKTPDGRRPGVVIANGHGGSKSSISQRYTGPLYAKLGIACLAFDTIGEEERHVDGGMDTRAHDEPQADARAASAGRLMIGKVIFDVMRGVDFLLSHEDIDPDRIGVVGQSMGGALASWMAALDPRLKVSIMSGACLGPDTAVVGHGKRCEYVPRQRMLELCDWTEYMQLSVPHCAILVMNGEEDFDRRWDWAQTSQIVANAAMQYKWAGADGKIRAWYQKNAGHRPYHNDKEALLWLEAYLGTPGWTRRQIEALPTILLAEWCDRHGIDYRRQLHGYQARLLNYAGAKLADAGIQPFSSEELKCLRPGEQGDPQYTLAGWLDQIEQEHGHAPQPCQPLLTTVDLNLGESQRLTLCNNQAVEVELINLTETCDEIRGAVRRSEVTVAIDGARGKLISATYHLPTVIGSVQIDCPITKGYYKNTHQDSWGLEKDVRLRLWPANSPLVTPGTFVYPVKQRWFASDTQMANEPVFVDGGEVPANRRIYYHNGLDIGGAEGLVEVISATNGLVIAAGNAVLQDERDQLPFKNSSDDVYIRDTLGWYYRYTHLQSIDEHIFPGRYVSIGQKIGVLGKEGGSGGWAHLHFEIKARQPSGKWGTQAGYALLWNAYLHRHQPPLIAVARPHCVAWSGEEVELDGSRSWSATGKIDHYNWQCTDGSFEIGPRVKRTYTRVGTYSEILKITDADGHIGYDFAVVQILDKNHPDQLPPTIHAAYAPTFDIHPGDPVTFKVRTFRTTEGQETWDFGDGSETTAVRSDARVKHDPNGYAATVHRYRQAGDYLVRVERQNNLGCRAIAHLLVHVGQTND